MTGNIVLEVVIGLIFIFLLYSLLATILGEVIASVFAMRARNLEAAIEKMLDDDTEEMNKLQAYYEAIGKSIKKLFYNKPEGIVKTFYNMPSIKYLAKNKNIKKPSYIGKENFSQTLINLIEEHGEGLTRIDKIKSILSENTAENKESKFKAINKLIEAKIADSAETISIEEIKQLMDNESGETILFGDETKKHLRNLLKNSNDDLVKFKLNLENWFDDTMDRATGWYKRKNQMILFTIGLAIAISFNVNTIYMAKTLAKDKNSREQLVQMASSFQEENTYMLVNDTTIEGMEYRKKLDTLMSIQDSLLKDIKVANTLLSLGWNKIKDASGKSYINESYYNYITLCNLNDKAAWKNLLGWIITALAISLGATFWFDLLNKLIKLRTSVQQGTQSSQINVSNNKEQSSPLNRKG